MNLRRHFAMPHEIVSGFWAVVVVLSVCRLSHIANAQVNNPDAQASKPVESPTNIDDLRKLQARVTEIIRKSLPTVVAVGNRFGSPNSTASITERRLASGVIIRADGLVLSQYHVSHEGRYEEKTGLVAYGKPGDVVDVVLHDGREVHAELLGGSKHPDVSMLRILEPGPYPFMELAQDGPRSLGDWVIKLGHPLGYQPSRSVVSRLGRIVYINPINLVPDCATTGGDSGGPLINLNGQLIGIPLDSLMPTAVVHLAKDSSWRRFHLSYISNEQIRTLQGTMQASVVPRDTLFTNHFERKKQFELVQEVLPPEHWRSGVRMIEVWKNVQAELRGSVVEIILGGKRVAYGTVVGQEGWILTTASAVKDYPQCRLPSGAIRPARIAAVDHDHDLAMLKVDTTELKPLGKSTALSPLAGTFVTTISLDGSPISAGIVSAPVHEFSVASSLKEKFTIRDGATVFDHDMPLEKNELGGPIISLDGRIIGMTVASAGPHGSVAVPLSSMLSIAARLKGNVDIP